MLNIAPCGGMTSHRMKLLSRVQVKVTVSSGQDTIERDVSVAEKIMCSSEHIYVESTDLCI